MSGGCGSCCGEVVFDGSIESVVKFLCWGNDCMFWWYLFGCIVVVKWDWVGR